MNAKTVEPAGIQLLRTLHMENTDASSK